MVDETTLEVARQMGIEPSQISMKNGIEWYESKEFGQLNDVKIPSADSITISRLLEKGETWGLDFNDEIGKRPKIDGVLDVEKIRTDMADYCDQRIIQYLNSGIPMNVSIPFRTEAVRENYKIEEKTLSKIIEKNEEELEKGIVGEWSMSALPRFREHPVGAIPKNRAERKKKANNETYKSRTISDFSKHLPDGLAINSSMGDFTSIELPQGDRVHRLIEEAGKWCDMNGLDKTELRGLKFDVQSAYRIIGIDPADWWAFCYTLADKRYFHKRMPFGITSAVYAFLRIPLLILTFLLTKTNINSLGAFLAMYFDDLVVIAHKSTIEKAGQIVTNLFQRWKIPVQATKWTEENPNGLKGTKEIVILGLEYDLPTYTVGIPAHRSAEIVEEIVTARENNKRWRLKEAESLIGIMSWAACAIPQLKPFMGSSWSLLRIWKNCKRQHRAIPGKILGDWGEIARILKFSNGKHSILEPTWKIAKAVGFITESNTVYPAADASGSVGWGAVCEYGFACGKWSEEEKDLRIHLKEGLALFALIAIFGEKLTRQKWKLILRSDNQALVSALNKGRAKDDNMRIIMRLIVDELIHQGVALRCWNERNKKAVDTQFIGTKENTLADCISRGDLKTYFKITNNFYNHKILQTRKQLPKRGLKAWKKAVEEIRRNICMQQTQRQAPRQRLRVGQDSAITLA